MRFLKILFALLLIWLVSDFSGPAPAMAKTTKRIALAYGLHPVDDQPLGDRIPLVLVHGINPNPKVQYGWGAFIKETARHPAYLARYKMYQFVFDPAAPVIDTSEQMRGALQAFSETLPEDRKVRVAALSLGGMLVRQSMNDETLRKRVDRFIAIGVPFHGTPLANPAWIKAQAKTQHFFAALRLTGPIAYRETERRFPNFMSDFCWDNFDAIVPESILKKDNCNATEFGEDVAAVPTITYAAFFGASAEDRQWLREYLAIHNPPAPGKLRRIWPWNRHIMFQVVQPAISGLPRVLHPLDPNDDSGVIRPLLAFNDGISPISSQLWLGRFLASENNQPLPFTPQWTMVAALKQTRDARLFEGLDHRDWLEGRTRYKHTGEVQDWLHPQEPPRTVFEWLIEDLMRD